MRKTKNLNLRLYDSADTMDITGSSDSLNHNMEILDEKVGGASTEIASLNDDVTSLKEDKVDKPVESPAVGKILKVKSVNEDGTFTCEWADMDGLDVQINGESIVENGVAEIPIGIYNKYSLFKIGSGMTVINGCISPLPATMNRIKNREWYSPITAGILDNSVKSAMCDGKGAAWTLEEQASARKRLGLEMEKIAEIVIPDDAEEASAYNINKDMNGTPFELVKARLCVRLPKYTGDSEIPSYSFIMLNHKHDASLFYTSTYPKVSKTIIAGMVYEVDVSGTQQIERRSRSTNNSYVDPNYIFGSAYDYLSMMYSDKKNIETITSIGGSQMLIYPGCKFVLYGVRA